VKRGAIVFVSALVVVFVCVIAGGGFAAWTLRDSPTDAADRAWDFVDALTVGRDTPVAYAMLTKAARDRLSESALDSAAKGSLDYGDLNMVEPTAYELVPGQAAIDVYLTGGGGFEPVFYTVRMAGTRYTGYAPESFSWSPERPGGPNRRDLP
jgi:hypothetical protein